MNNYTIERDIEIEAPVEVVWRTITEPELIRTWFSDVADVEARARRGRARSRSGQTRTTPTSSASRSSPPIVRTASRIVGCIRPASDATEANSTLVTFTLVADGDERTRLRVVETGLDQMDLTDDEKQKFLEDHRHGWQVQGDRLRDLFATGHASSP